MHAKVTPATSTVPIAKANTATDPNTQQALSIMIVAANDISTSINTKFELFFFIGYRL